MDTIAIERLEPDVVTMELTRHLQGMALHAWRRVLPHRPKSELRQLFNPYDDTHLKKTRDIYKSFAEEQGLLVAVPEGGVTHTPVGFLLTKEDVSGTPEQQAFKRAFHPGKVYALIQHLVVAPEVQGRGIGKQLARVALGAYKLEQVPTAYLFDEHEFAMRAIGRYGYTLAPPDQTPEPQFIFGEGTTPMYQYRFAGVSVGMVLEQLEASSENT